MWFHVHTWKALISFILCVCKNSFMQKGSIVTRLQRCTTHKYNVKISLLQRTTRWRRREKKSPLKKNNLLGLFTRTRRKGKENLCCFATSCQPGELKMCWATHFNIICPHPKDAQGVEMNRTTCSFSKLHLLSKIPVETFPTIIICIHLKSCLFGNLDVYFIKVLTGVSPY